MIPLREYPFGETVMVVAHRGDSGHAPENTLAAFERAVASGAAMVELDVQRTREGRLVVIHDATLRRTTNGSGYVARKTFAELSLLDAGGWFGASFAGERIPSLDDALDLLRGRMYVDIEIKPSAARGPVVPLLLQSLRRHAMESATLISSFHHGVLRAVKFAAPEIATAIIVPPRSAFGSFAAAARGVNAEAVVCGVHQLARRRCADARAHGFPVCVYTVNSARALAKALRCGVSAVVTNFPAEISRAVRLSAGSRR